MGHDANFINFIATRYQRFGEAPRVGEIDGMPPTASPPTASPPTASQPMAGRTCGEHTCGEHTCGEHTCGGRTVAVRYDVGAGCGMGAIPADGSRRRCQIAIQ